MYKSRRMLSAALTVLAACMVMLLLSGSFGGRAYAENNDFSWSIDESGVLIITGSGKMPVWNSDSQCEWYSRRSEIIRVVIESGITSIGDYAFKNCKNLRAVSIASSVTEIGEDAFYGCIALTDISIPYGVKSVGERAFSNVGCTEIILPDSITYLGERAFAESVSLEKVVLPANITMLDTYLFGNCSKLSDISIPEGVFSIGPYAFAGCKGLTDITLPEELEYICYNAFENCTGLRAIDIPESVCEVGESAFQGCTSLERVKISALGVSIMSDAFTECVSLSYFDAPVEIYISGNPFLNDFALIDSAPFTFTVAEGKERNTETGTYIYWELSSDGILTLSGNAEMQEYEFSDYIGWGSCAEYVTKVVLEEGIQSVGANAFVCMENLCKVILPSTIEKIGDSAFAYCDNLERINLPDSIATIGSQAFAGCSALSEEVTLPKNIKTIGYKAFAGCNAITEVIIPQDIESIGEYAFTGCDSLSRIVMCGRKVDWNRAVPASSVNVSLGEIVQYHDLSSDGICKYCDRDDPYPDTEFGGYSLSLDGSLCMNLYFSADEEVLSDEEAYVRFILPGEESQKVLIVTAEKALIGEEEYYVAGCRVAAKDMQKMITAQIAFGNNTTIKSRSFSVAEYAEELMQDETYRYRDFAEAFLNYGSYAESYFNGEDSNPKNYGEDDEDRILSALPVPNLVPGAEDYIGSSLLLEHSTVLRHYYSGYAEDRTGKSITTPAGKQTAYYVQKAFAPNSFDETFGDCDFTVYDYVYMVLNDESASGALKNLCIALYDYSVACAELN